MSIVETMRKNRDEEYNNLVKEIEGKFVPEKFDLGIEDVNILVKKHEEHPMSLVEKSFLLGFTRGEQKNRETQRVKVNSSMVYYELGRVLPQLMALNYTNRMTAREIRDDIENKVADLDTINAEMYHVENLLLIENDILDTLGELINRTEN